MYTAFTIMSPAAVAKAIPFAVLQNKYLKEMFLFIGLHG